MNIEAEGMAEPRDEMAPPSSCEVGSDQRSDASDEGARRDSKVVRFEDYRWEGIEVRAYEGSAFRGVSRHPLVGESEGTPFHVRYFEIEPGGYTTLERHRHQHVVIALRGRGEVLLEDGWEQLDFGDVVYVAPNDAHQFRAVNDEPFGFICIVAAERDRPTPL